MDEIVFLGPTSPTLSCFQDATVLCPVFEFDKLQFFNEEKKITSVDANIR